VRSVAAKRVGGYSIKLFLPRGGMLPWQSTTSGVGVDNKLARGKVKQIVAGQNSTRFFARPEAASSHAKLDAIRKSYRKRITVMSR
jgi:hypothetical protein